MRSFIVAGGYYKSEHIRTGWRFIIIILIIIMNLHLADSISQNLHRRCNVCAVTFYSI